MQSCFSVCRLTPVSSTPSAVDQWVTCPAPAPLAVLLHSASALLQGLTSRVDEIERVHPRHLNLLPPHCRPPGKPGLEGLLRAARYHVQQPCRAPYCP